VAYDKIVDNKRQLAIGNNCYWAKNSHIFNYHGMAKVLTLLLKKDILKKLVSGIMH